MKKLWYLLLVFLVATFECMAQNKSNAAEQVSLSVKTDHECVTYNFGTVKDLEENLELLLDEIVKTIEETASSPLVIELKTVTSVSKSVITGSTNPRPTVATAIKNLFASLQKDLSQ